MIYVNYTGKHIGECLTGFGINAPITIINSGNSDVLYTFDIQNDTNKLFSLSSSTLILNNGSSGVVDIFYKPQEIASATDNDCDFIISSQSIEDGAVDPSGNITIEITGSRIINNTAGHVRNLVALKNYDRVNGINYDFIWSPPTGTGTLKNYFFTGYQLDIATSNTFSSPSIVFSANYNIAENTDKNPRFSKYYGYSADEKIKHNVSKNNFTTLDFDIDYYARLYTYSVGNSGINIYATGIDNLNNQLSNEVINGFSGAAATRPSLKFEKKMLDVIITQGNYVNYDLYSKIKEANGGSTDLGFYSGINIYLSAGSNFYSSDEQNYALSLNKGIFQNFSGNNTNGTNINIYVPERVSIVGNHGKGGDISNIILDADKISTSNSNFSLSKIFDVSSYTSKNGMSDSKVGGNALNLNSVIQIKNETTVRTDINYNLYIQKSSQLTSGGGGNKAGVAIVGGNYIGTGSDNIDRATIFPIRGSNNNQNTFFRIRKPQTTTFQELIRISSPNPQYGEDAVDNIIKYIFKNNNFESNTNVYSYPSTSVYTPNTLGDLQTQFIKINNNAASSCGYLINKFLNASLTFNFYNDAVVPDYIFRCNNVDLTNTPSWAGKNSSGSTIVNLTGNGQHIANFESFGYEAMALDNSKYLQGTFSSSIDCVDFDLFIVGCFKGLTYPNQFIKMLNWFSSSTNIAAKNILLRPFLSTAYKAFSKEDNVYSFFYSLLYNDVIANADEKTFYQSTKDPALIGNYYQISKQLNTSGANYYPYILNIQRSNGLYAIFINGERYCLYGLPDKNKLLNNLNSTTLQLFGDSTTVTNYFFDIIFYNRSLFDNEKLQMYNSLSKQYIKLFSGQNDSSLVVNERIRLPNLFNIAGKINIQTL
jgi:hypothetical protein